MRLTTTLRKIPLSQIHVPQSRDLWRPASRCSPEGLADLVNQIESVGWVEAVVVRERKKGGGYELLDGERRVKAERKQGSKRIDAVIVKADDKTAAAITLLAQLPKTQLPQIHWARLVAWVRIVSILGGGRGTHEEIAQRIGRDPSMVSRHRTVQKGLTPAILRRAGLVDEDLEEVSGPVLRTLAKLPKKDRVSALRKVHEVKVKGGDATTMARCAAKTVSTTKRGRPSKPYNLTNRSDGRVRFTLSGAPLDKTTAHEVLNGLEPVLLRLTEAAGLASLDDFLGMARPSLAACMNRHIRLVFNKMHDLAAAKCSSISGAYTGAGLGRLGPALTK